MEQAANFSGLRSLEEKAMNFEVYGPFKLNTEADADGFSGWIDPPEIKKFWENVNRQHENLDNACGVYIFSVQGKLKNKGKETNLPWYVGKAENQTFEKECFRNQHSYNKVISQLYREKTAINFYFVARHDEDGKLSAPAKKDDGTVYEGVRFVERLFMQKSLAVNKQLLNVKDLTDARRTHIRNLLNWPVQGRDDNSAAALKDSLGIEGHLSLLEKVSPKESEQPKQSKLGFYPVYGPYEFPAYKSGTKTIDAEFISAFWDQFAGDSEITPDFAKATGVYVIGVRHGNNITPHHIGTSKGYSYQLACFQERSQLEGIVRKSGTPVVFFLPRVSDKSNQKIEGIKKTKSILGNMEFVEKWLLGYGIAKNLEITTGEGVIATIMRELRIEGFVNSRKRGKPSKSVHELRDLLKETKE